MKTLKKILKRIFLLGLLQKTGMLKKLGFYLMPIHYYYPVPDLDKTKRDRCWNSKPKKIPGIDLNENCQLRLLQVEFPKFVNEYDFPLEKNDIENPDIFYFNNHMFANTDAEVYYCMIRYLKPNKIVEVGAGRSTQICCAAVEKNRREDDVKAEIFAIEPYANREILTPLSRDTITLIESKVEETDPTLFQQLNENDILFIDSTHVVRSGGDVNYLYLEILPNLNPGPVVHVHDIKLPYEVSKSDLMNGYFWTEQYLFQAFLIGNKDYEILWGTHFISKKFQADVGKIFRSSREGKYIGGSFWIRKKRE